MVKAFFETQFNHDSYERSRSFDFFTEGESLTVQDEKDEADINKMMDRFGITGSINLTKASPLPDDYLRVSSFHEAVNVVRAAQESFNELPADVRAKFENDPGRFEAFLQDPDNANIALKSGLVEKIVEAKIPQPVRVEVVNPEPKAPVDS